MVKIGGKTYHIAWDNYATKELGDLLGHKTLSETLLKFQEISAEFKSDKEDKEITYSTLDALSKMAYVAIKTGEEKQGNICDITKREVYNTIIKSPEAIGEVFTVAVETLPTVREGEEEEKK